MRLLGIETSSAVGSVALEVDGDVLEREIASPREQTEQLLKLIDELLAAVGVGLRDLDAVTFGCGPGSFTGLRVAAAAAQGFALATAVPLVPVSSLWCLAERAHRQHGAERVVVVVDARMGEVYSASFELQAGLPALVGRERLGAPDALEPPLDGPWTAVGDGFAAYAAELAGVVSGRRSRVGRFAPARERSFRSRTPRSGGWAHDGAGRRAPGVLARRRRLAPMTRPLTKL